MLFDEINTGSDYTYRIYLTQRISTGVGTTTSNRVIGAIRETGAEFVRVRRSSGYRSHVDLIIPKETVLYIEEVYSAE